MSTFVGSIVGRPFGFNSGNNSFVVAMSFMSRYLAPTILGPCSKLVVTHTLSATMVKMRLKNAVAHALTLSESCDRCCDTTTHQQTQCLFDSTPPFAPML